MSYQAFAWVREQRTGDQSMKALLFALANYADEKGMCWPSQEALAFDTESSVRSVRRNLAKLEEAKFIRREARRAEKHQCYLTDLIHLAMPASGSSEEKASKKSKSTSRPAESQRPFATEPPANMANGQRPFATEPEDNLSEGQRPSETEPAAICDTEPAAKLAAKPINIETPIEPSDSFGAHAPAAPPAPPKSEGSSKGTRIPDDFVLSDFLIWQASRVGLGETAAKLEFDKFRDYWVSKAGVDARKTDWVATWRNWCRTAAERIRNAPKERPKFTPRIRPTT